MIRIQMFFTALPLAFGVLHLVLYAVMPRMRNNLWFALFLVCMATTTFADFQSTMSVDPEISVVWQRVQRGSLTLAFVFVLRFYNGVFLERSPKYFPFVVAALLLAGGLAVIEPVAWFAPLQLMIVGGLIEWVRGFIVALRRRRREVIIIGVGFTVFWMFASYDLLLDVSLIRPIADITNAYQFGLVGLYLASSVYLARGIARTQEQVIERDRLLHTQELQSKLLKAEVERTQRELEQARELQMSMLPASLPQTSRIKASALLMTATEVGGDYYDVRVYDDESITFAVGDATGHGLRAGIMVAMMKSLFQGLRRDEDLIDFLRHSSGAIKASGLGNLFMGLTLIRLNGHDLEITAAGMPTVYIYRAAEQRLDEFTLKVMPLGAFPEFPYRSVRTTFEPDDVLVACTDGLPELFNSDRDAFDDDRVKDTILAHTSRTPREIVTHIAEAIEAWRGDTPLHDDVTVLILRSASSVAHWSTA